MVKHFDTCLCANLRTGTIIIAVLGIIGGLFYMGSAGFGGNNTGGTVARIILAILGVVSMILNVVLLYGAIKNKPKLIRPWILVTAVLVCLALIVTVAKGIQELISGHVTEGVSSLFGALIGALIQVYCILIVNSFHTVLINGDPVATQTA